MSTFISPASAAVIGSVKVTGTVGNPSHSTASTPPNKNVYQYMWQDAWNRCTLDYSGTKSLALTRVDAPFGQSQYGYWSNVSSYWDCKDTP
ncbi:hypothetical protein NX81_000365 [Xanthomonas vasicola]|uniref:hypothetical protein n=1 Tax=Xanthomonas vasicola TaxID=56459 RepID=UPI0009EA4531|nr:hypothetical protein [Xanthomonas vasicola]AZR21086.1 hypothetical protein NX81_000365 [Xanthomonas vasicola]